MTKGLLRTGTRRYKRHSRAEHVTGNPSTLRALNERVCGKPVANTVQGLIQLLKQKFSDDVHFETAISVGCGTAVKEMRLLKQGIVGHFDLFELSEARIEKGRELAREAGLEDRLTFHSSDVFKLDTSPGSYDLVFWASSLHHMMDTKDAIRWSKDMLRPQGVLAIDDFVGPTRMQWSDFALDVTTKIKQGMADRYLVNPHNPEKQLSRRQHRPDPEKIEAADPSECADSQNILPGVQEHFPDADIRPIGGMVMLTALNDMLANLDEDADDGRTILNLLLLIDELCARLGEVYRAVIVAQK